MNFRPRVLRSLSVCLALLCLVLTGWALDARVYSPSYLVSNYAGYPGQGTTDGAGLAQAQFAYPQGVAVDAAGNRYVADTANHTIRRITPAGVVTTLAGKAGTADFRNGRAGEAWFNRPAGIAVSADGATIYVADTGNHLLRRITTASGEVVTVVGAAQLSGGAEGDETTARLNSPTGLALATDGTLYVADTGNHRIRKIVFGSGSAVTVTTLAGNSTPPADSVNGTGTAAKFNQPVALAINSAQTELYVAEVASHVVRRITLSTSSVITLAGLEGLAGSTGGTGTSARFNKPSGLAFNPAGTELFVADQGSHLLRKIVIAGGTVSTVAGTNLTEGSASGAALITARFRQPSGLAYDGVAGGVVVADTANSQLRLYDPVSDTVSTLAGAPEPKNSTDGSAAAARFNTPAAVALHTDGTLYVADRGNHVIRRITAGGVVSTVAGAAGAAGTVDGAAGTARFNQPSALALNATGTELFVADAGTTGVITSGRVRRIVLGPGEVTVSTLSGTFNDPRGLALTTAGVLYLSETGAGRIWTYATTGSAPTLWVSSGLNRPWGLVAEPSGAIFVADSYNNSVKKLTPGTPVTVTILAGTGTSVTGANDGTGAAATFYYPYGLARDNAGNIYVAELENDLVRRITPAGVVTTLAGSPQAAGYADGAEGATRLRNPLGLAVTGDGGTIYVADGDNQTVRKLSTLPAPSFTGASTVNGTYGQAFAYSVQAAPAITAYGLTGSLPAGLSFDSARGQITGVPTVSGVYNITLSATNSAGTTAFSLTITLAKQTVTITLGGLNPRWDGTNRVPTAVTSNGTYTVAFTYNGSPTPPTKVGTYTVVATVDETNFTGTATGTLTVLPPEVYTVGALPGGADVIAEGLAVDGAGNVYSADTAANLIRKLTPEGVLTDIVMVDDPTGVVVTSDGTLYISTTTVLDEISTGYIKRFNPAVGVVEPFASGFTATGALVLSRDGTKLFFSDSDANGAYVRQIALADATVTTLATWLEGFPTGIAEAPDGTLYVTDLAKNHINKLSLGVGGVLVELFAGSATDLEGSLDGTGANALFDTPYGLIYTTDAALLVSDYGNSTLRRVSVPTATVSTVAGSASSPGNLRVDGVGSAARLANPRALVLLPGGSVVFSDTQYTYDIDGNIIAKNSSLRLATPPPRVPVITSATSAQAAQSVPFTYTIGATGVPTNYAATGLPAGLSINSGTGVISGIPAESGVFNINLSAGNAVGDCQGTLILTLAPPSYSAWQAINFTATELAETTLAAVGSDADGDGFANIIEYALGSNPRTVSSVPFVQTIMQGGYLQLTYNRLRAHSSSNLTITPEVSTDLQTWRTGASYLQEISALPLDTLREQVVVRSLSPLSTSGRSFLRLKIQLNSP